MQWQGQKIWGILFQKEDIFTVHDGTIMEKPLEMSSSWNFPAQASPSNEGSEPSQAELGHFNVRAEPELTKIKMLGPN